MTPQARIFVGAGLFAAFITLSSTFFTVRENEQAIVLQFGRIVRLADTPGLHAKVPFAQDLMYFDKRVLASDSPPEEVQTLDKKRIVVDSFTRWRITDAAKFFKAVRTEEIANQRLNTIVGSAIRAEVADVAMNKIVATGRSVVLADVVSSSNVQAAPLGIRIVDVRLKRVDLPPENSEAVYRRMRAEREKEAREIRAQGDEQAQIIVADADKQRTILLAQAERDAQKMRGEGDGTALRIGGDAFGKNPDFYSLIRSLDAYKASLQASNTLFVLDGQKTEFLKKFTQ